MGLPLQRVLGLGPPLPSLSESMNRRRRKELYIAIAILIGIFVAGWFIAQFTT